MGIPTAAEIDEVRNSDASLYGYWPEDRRTLLSALDAVTAENKVLRTCFCIADDETVVSSVEGSVLIDNKVGTRRRYFVATDDERKLKEQLDAVNDKLKRAQSTIRFTLASEVYDFDLVKGCEAICESLHREEDAHSKTRQAMETDKRHIREQIADKHRILGEYQTRLDAVTAERDRLLGECSHVMPVELEASSRIEDMSPDGMLTARRQRDGDMVVIIRPSSTATSSGFGVDVEFCTHAGGGQSPRTRTALEKLMVAMWLDTQERGERR